MSAARFLYCWFDTEYTDLDTDRAKILEVALVVTDAELRPLKAQPEGVPAELLRSDGFSGFVQPPAVEEISEHVLQNYQPLLERCRREGRSIEEIDGYLAAYMDCFSESGVDNVKLRPTLSGNSIYADHALVRRFLPQFKKRLNYRLFDVTTFKLEWLAYYHGEKFDKLDRPENIARFYPGNDPIIGGKHDAYYDVQASIAELAYYRSQMKRT